MASIYFYLPEGKKSVRTVFMRVILDGTKYFKLSTRRHKADVSLWPEISKNLRGRQKQLDAESESIINDLDNLRTTIKKGLKYAESRDSMISSELIRSWIAEHEGLKTPEQKFDERLISQIDKAIGSSKKNLSKETISHYRTTSELIGQFNKNLRVKDIGPDVMMEYFKWMREIGYQDKTSKKYWTKVRATINQCPADLERHPLFNKATFGEYDKSKSKAQRYEDDARNIIVLNPDELRQIEETPMPSPHLNNAKMWLLFGCSIGQRGGDLLRIKESDILTSSKGTRYVKIVQEKGQKPVPVVFTNETERVIADCLPYAISMVNARKYFKEVCRISGIDDSITGWKQQGKGFSKLVTAPKYQWISLHTCRRSFCSNGEYHSDIPRNTLMQQTGHKLEKDFLTYIGDSGESEIDSRKELMDGKEVNRLARSAI